MAFLLREVMVINSTVGWNGYLFLFVPSPQGGRELGGYTIITFSICFICNTKLGNLLDTFYSLNANPHGDSRRGGIEMPNQQETSPFGLAAFQKKVMEKIGSSETIRGNTYDLFKKNFAYFFKQEFSVPDDQEDND